mgnify:CR=1 FL=1
MVCNKLLPDYPTPHRLQCSCPPLCAQAWRKNLCVFFPWARRVPFNPDFQAVSRMDTADLLERSYPGRRAELKRDIYKDEVTA